MRYTIYPKNKTVKEKLDEGWYVQYILYGNSEEHVRREVLKDLTVECGGVLEEENIIYAMFIWGEVIKQFPIYNKA